MVLFGKKCIIFGNAHQHTINLPSPARTAIALYFLLGTINSFDRSLDIVVISLNRNRNVR